MGNIESKKQHSKQASEMDKMMKDASHITGGGVLAFITELIKIVLIALAIIIPVRYFLIKPFYVNGASMEPTYQNREYLIIDEISYRFSEPIRGEVVVFKYPEDPSQFFIKRIIGLPNERLVVQDGSVVLYNSQNPNGLTLNEPYLSDNIITVGFSDVKLGKGEYFVLGDNRTASLDSRRFGPLMKDELIGKVWLRGWPLNRIGVLQHYSFGF
ncbi:signal peptidase I [bacterium]|jgi:signal peptidase I|nr:signal peptidase I [bacterium]MDP6571707.1 signal peptidase I [Patescibacteria group bacterium]MDP6756070.1 signal peptidase I [Patescibacteria group bacterium]|tara:strand:- start:5105 stop:5743 length:639 start_codon:yes stop_codon:yes gene_type:complete